MTIEQKFDSLLRVPDAAACVCHPRDRTLSLVLARLLPRGGCMRCAAIDALHGLAKLQDRTPDGLFVEIAAEIGAPGSVVIVGYAWDDLHEALDDVLLDGPHTCAGSAR